MGSRAARSHAKQFEVSQFVTSLQRDKCHRLHATFTVNIAVVSVNE